GESGGTQPGVCRPLLQPAARKRHRRRPPDHGCAPATIDHLERNPMGRAFVAIVVSLLLFAAPGRAESQIERGRYLVDTLAACGNCHTPKGPNGPLPGKKFAGGDVIKHADFTAVTPNITPDPETGIGRWTDHQIFLAIREGRRPGGSLLGPAMPTRSYRNIADEDVKAMIAYSRSVPPVYNLITPKSH